jgi:hypothetical protein
MTVRSDRFVTSSDVEPLLEIATQNPDRRLRTEALTASALLPLDEAAIETVSELVLPRLRTEHRWSDGVIAAVGNLSVPEVRSLLEQWAADPNSPHQEAAERSRVFKVERCGGVRGLGGW